MHDSATDNTSRSARTTPLHDDKQCATFDFELESKSKVNIAESRR